MYVFVVFLFLEIEMFVGKKMLYELILVVACNARLLSKVIMFSNKNMFSLYEIWIKYIYRFYSYCF
jgi:hypothetical protein